LIVLTLRVEVMPEFWRAENPTFSTDAPLLPCMKGSNGSIAVAHGRRVMVLGRY